MTNKYYLVIQFLNTFCGSEFFAFQIDYFEIFSKNGSLISLCSTFELLTVNGYFFYRTIFKNTNCFLKDQRESTVTNNRPRRTDIE